MPRVLVSVLARYRADLPCGLDVGLTGEADMGPAWDAGMRAARQRWCDAIILDTTAELAATMHAKLARVWRDGGKQPLYSAAAVALLCEIGELARDRFNGTCVCWVDDETGILTAEGATGGPPWWRTLMATSTRLGCRLEVRP
jgi:hypothetical protein